MRTRSILVWVTIGLLGLALAAGVSYAATQLSSQRIGLSAEPPSAGEALAPPAATGRSLTTTAPPGRTSTSGGTATSGANDADHPHEGYEEPPEAGSGDWDD